MKKFILFLSLFVINSVFSQKVSLNELILLAKMNDDEFDTFCIKKGYDIHLIENDDYSENITYIFKKNEMNFSTNYISKFNYKTKNKIMVSYQTTSPNYISIKNEIKSNGFIFIENKLIDETYYLEYKKNNLELSLASFKTKNKDNIEITQYEISLTLLKD